MLTKKSPNISKKLKCDKCNYICSKQSEYNKHLLTAKHKRLTNVNYLSPNDKHMFECRCGKIYNQQSGLSRHKKLCSYIDSIQNDDSNDNKDNTEIVQTMMHLIKQNQEFKTLLIEQQHENQSLQKQLLAAVKDSGNTYTTNNNNNQQFNLNFFLNTTCKDAMNMTEFIENIEVDFKDIENIGKNGYVSGMTNMILSRIKELDVTKRPMHCTDLKRETMYIKDNDEWNKETPENSRLHKMIDSVAKRNYAKIPLWREKYPECQEWDHPQYDFCISMMRNILGDVGIEHKRLDNKVIKNLSRHILVDKAASG
jgi:hypothetical protein|uniref:C2H2-type domain-containing protein n=1 Tax=viral metagenome TaxID=1070528 RepID=A0A6C0IPH8_9ZZZZ